MHLLSYWKLHLKLLLLSMLAASECQLCRRLIWRIVQNKKTKKRATMQLWFHIFPGTPKTHMMDCPSDNTIYWLIFFFFFLLFSFFFFLSNLKMNRRKSASTGLVEKAAATKCCTAARLWSCIPLRLTVKWGQIVVRMKISFFLVYELVTLPKPQSKHSGVSQYVFPIFV